MSAKMKMFYYIVINPLLGVRSVIDLNVVRFCVTGLEQAQKVFNMTVYNAAEAKFQLLWTFSICNVLE